MDDVNDSTHANHVKLGVFDMDGLLRGKYLTKSKFAGLADSTLGFCDVVLGWDMHDRIYDDGVHATGWHTGYPDAAIALVDDSPRQFPGDTTPFYLCQFVGEKAKICPRQLLQKVVRRANDMGFYPKVGFEYEFFVFDETPSTVADKGFQDLTPFTSGNCGYSVLRNTVEAPFYQALLGGCAEMGIAVEGLHCETGPGVLEAALTADSAMLAADNAALFKTVAKVIAQQHGLMATFMAKWSNKYPGQSGHMHISLQDKQGTPQFYSAQSEDNLSDTMRHFLAGQQRYMPELLPMIAPTVNSYTRLIPGFWAPTEASAGIDNRTCALRLLTGSAKSQRIEYRVSGSDANPYLALAAAIASGLWGIEQQLEPLPLVTGNAYEQELPAEYKLADNLSSAVDAFTDSEMARKAFGEDFCAHFAATRKHEVNLAKQAVTDWQLARYFELI